MLDTILNSIVPVFFVIALGWFSGKKKIVSVEHKKAFADYVMMFSFPLHLFIGSAKADPKTLLGLASVFLRFGTKFTTFSMKSRLLRGIL